MNNWKIRHATNSTRWAAHHPVHGYLTAKSYVELIRKIALVK